VTTWEIVVGLETHVQLATKSKLFSPARNRFGDAPNANVDVVDVALPGTLPVLNGEAVEMAVKLGLALGCTIHKRSVFARKHYFYPDLPKGYQISQYEEPILTGGAVVVGEKTIRLTRIHIEEDAGKSMHVAGRDASYIDYNRAGTPLLEVVSEPDLRSADEAMEYFRTLRTIVMYLGVCDGNLQEGSMRCDANVSVRKPGAPLGQRVELKNINSPRYLANAIEHESRRQIALIERGGVVTQETRLWDPDKRESRVMRTKEDAEDYRYFPDPDLPPLIVGDDDVTRIKTALPELPAQKRDRYVSALGLTAYDAGILTAERAVASFFEDALARHSNAKGIANWVINEVLRVVNERSLEADQLASVLAPVSLADLVKLVDDGVISGKIAKDVFAALVAGEGADPVAIVDAKGLRVQRDEGALKQIVDEVIAANPGEWKKLVEGKGKVMGFFVGQIMKKSGGKADPKDVNRLLQAAVDAAKVSS
jgi:aspartyl-tRNA(Asn)/glutamyl-tRNA(Gln) amidotransferase subunit B